MDAIAQRFDARLLRRLVAGTSATIANPAATDQHVH
jgi:hypothetical protein